MTVRACTFNSRAASVRRLDVFLRKKKGVMRIRQPDAAILTVSLGNVIT
jgi:hypothetical protein